MCRRQQLIACVQLLAPEWGPVLIRVAACLGGPEPVHLPRRILLPYLRRRLLTCSIQQGLIGLGFRAWRMSRV